MINRRNFLGKMLQWLGLATLIPHVQSCKRGSLFTGKIVGQNATLGHRLRTMDFPPVTHEETVDVAIVGGGIAGLSAARYLNKQRVEFKLLELNENPGGNSAAGKNDITAFPWGAHYLPLPGDHDRELIAFLHESGAITGFENGLPVYNEYYLCFDPKERLYINNYWQEGIIPYTGLPLKDLEEIDRFQKLMHHYKTLVGSDGRPAFAIPVGISSQDKDLLALDSITIAEFLQQQNFSSSYLKWYVNYCCADDFGSSVDETSAWAGIHYFASRKRFAFNAEEDAVLTWPEGNYWLVEQLKKDFQDRIQPNAIVYRVESVPDGVHIYWFNAATNISVKLKARSVIMATPQFINQRLLAADTRQINYQSFEYAPWAVANISLKSDLNERRGEPLSWDNVIYGSTSLGYVNALHQHTKVHAPDKVITYYKPLTGPSHQSRKDAYIKTFDDWKNLIMSDLKQPHPDIENQMSEMNVWVWGHGMIKPVPGLIWSDNLRNARKPIDNKIFFAHSDLSGLSIFEEAFYHGHRAAKELMGT